MYGLLTDEALGWLRPSARRVKSGVPEHPLITLDDLANEGYFGLQKAAEIYDPSKTDIPFPNVAKRMIRNAMLDYVRRVFKTTGYNHELRNPELDMSLNAPLNGTDAEDNLNPLGTLKAPDDVFEEVSFRVSLEKLRNAIQKIPNEKQRAAALAILDGKRRRILPEATIAAIIKEMP